MAPLAYISDCSVLHVSLLFIIDCCTFCDSWYLCLTYHNTLPDSWAKSNKCSIKIRCSTNIYPLQVRGGKSPLLTFPCARNWGLQLCQWPLLRVASFDTVFMHQINEAVAFRAQYQHWRNWSVLGLQPPPRKGNLRHCWYHTLEAPVWGDISGSTE